MKILPLVFLILVTPIKMLSQNRIVEKPIEFKIPRNLGSYVFKYDSSDVLYFYSADTKKSYFIDSLIFQKNRADSLCREITFISKKAEAYFQALQFVYKSLRNAGLDSLADRIKGISWSYRFRICEDKSR